VAQPPSLRAQFPSGPLIDETGEITPVWRAYFSQLYIRTGGAAGTSSDTTQLQADLDAEEAARQAADLTLTAGLVAERTAREAADSAEAAARAQADAQMLPKAGGTMTGNIILPAATPTLPRQAVSKSYVDAAGGALQSSLRSPNYADNSGFSVNQRGYVSGTALGVGAYGHDRWKAGAGGCTYTFTVSSGPSTTITIATGTLQQVVDGLSVAGGNYMLSWTGTAQGRVGAGSYAVSPVAVTGIVAGVNTTLEFNTGTLAQVKFEAGMVVTPWVALTAANELANCQRFYFIGAVEVLSNVYAANGYLSAMVGLPVTMRALPTVTPTWSTQTNTASPGVGTMGPSAVLAYVQGSASGVVVLIGTFTASADL
jgi:hypothetical protein